MTGQHAAAFHAMHHADQPLLLPNAWDYVSAAALVNAGFAAIGTTSMGVALAHGLPDAQGVARTQTVALARLLSRLPRPVTVDVEAGFSDDPGAVADLAAELAELGMAGINLEDGRAGGTLADPDRQAEVIRAVKTRTPGLFVNARTDTHWLAGDRPPELAQTLDRARRYVEAGADGIFVPALAEDADIAAVVAAVAVPVNVLFLPHRHTLRGLVGLGVRRVSTGSLLFRAAVHAAVGTAEAIRDGAPTAVDVPGYAQFQQLVT